MADNNMFCFFLVLLISLCVTLVIVLYDDDSERNTRSTVVYQNSFSKSNNFNDNSTVINNNINVTDSNNSLQQKCELANVIIDSTKCTFDNVASSSTNNNKTIYQLGNCIAAYSETNDTLFISARNANNELFRYDIQPQQHYSVYDPNYSVASSYGTAPPYLIATSMPKYYSMAIDLIHFDLQYQKQYCYQEVEFALFKELCVCEMNNSNGYTSIYIQPCQCKIEQTYQFINSSYVNATFNNATTTQQNTFNNETIIQQNSTLVSTQIVNKCDTTQLLLSSQMQLLNCTFNSTIIQNTTESLNSNVYLNSCNVKSNSTIDTISLLSSENNLYDYSVYFNNTLVAQASQVSSIYSPLQIFNDTNDYVIVFQLPHNTQELCLLTTYIKFIVTNN